MSRSKLRDETRLHVLAMATEIAAQAAQMSNPGELAVFAELARTGAENEILEEASLLLADTA